MCQNYEQPFRSICTRLVYAAKELERVLGREKAFEIIGRGVERNLVESIKRQMAEGGPIEDFEDFKTMQKKVSRPLLTFVIEEETPKKVKVHVTECFWAKTFKDMNATDLGYIMFCHPDFAIAQAFHPKIRLERTRTLMQGDSCCDHTYCWEE